MKGCLLDQLHQRFHDLFHIISICKAVEKENNAALVITCFCNFGHASL